MKLSARIWTVLAIFLLTASTSECWWFKKSVLSSDDDGSWSDRVQDTWNDAKEKARDVWHNVQDKAEYATDFAGGTLDMADAYFDMRRANRVDKDTDKYFHARGNYEAANRGPGGRRAAEIISDLREAYGQWKGDPLSDKAADERANEWGRNGGDPNIYRPPNLPDEYKR